MGGVNKNGMRQVGRPKNPPHTPKPWEELLNVKNKNTRTTKLRLLPTKQQEEKLDKHGDEIAKLWNETTYKRRRMFFEKKHVNLKSTYKESYKKYKNIIG
ncbi:MAG: helix-turn-helix domain-containing protein, partial [Thermoprotei archaeon]